MNNYKALYLSGRKKFVIKQKGFNVFPGEIEEHIAQMEGVNIVDVVGVKHSLFDEGIFAFVQATPGVFLQSDAVMAHCKSIASYKRPQHVEIWPEGEDLPLTRSAKVDKMLLLERAEKIVAKLRQNGKWDAQKG